jgi:AcrR family transcriptional regulator
VSAEQARTGRPRSERARIAVLHAVDDLLEETGYAGLTMKGIAERAGVGRQTVYRWWSTKAEVLFEATMIDAGKELFVAPGPSTLAELTAYAERVAAFLTASQAGAAYCALVGEAQHDPAVAAMMSTATLFDSAAEPVLARAVQRGDLPAGTDVAAATALLAGPLLFRRFTGGQLPQPRAHAGAVLAALTAGGGQPAS